MLTEKERERRFWWLSLFFVLASPLTLYVLVRTHYSFAFNPFVFSIFCFVSIPLSLLVDAVLIKLFDTTSSLRFWVVKPADEVRHLLSMPVQNGEVLFEDLQQRTRLKSILDMTQARLEELGFESPVTADASGGSVIAFRKAKRDPVLSFIDHSFFGEAQVRLLGAAVEVRVRTTFDDTLLLETGEFERIRALGNYISLKSPKFSYQNVPLIVYCGVNLALVTSIVAMVPYLNRQFGNLGITCRDFVVWKHFFFCCGAGMILAVWC